MSDNLPLARGRDILNSAVDYLYAQGQDAQTAFERDGYSLALALIGALKRGVRDPLTVASYKAFGGSLEKYRQRRAEFEWLRHQEFLRTIPDYDPIEAERVKLALARPTRVTSQIGEG